jgi:CRP-like cAMP-binding protein
MISPEILRRYPFFSGLDDAGLKAVAMISEEVCFEKGETIYATGQPNTALFMLTEGNVETYLVIDDPNNPAYHKEYYLDDLDLGEVFGISAMVEPKVHTTTARASKAGKLIRIDGNALEDLFDCNCGIGYVLMKEMAATLLYRLQQDRIQLAAAR